MKVEVEFPAEFTSDKPGVIPIGRLYLGGSDGPSAVVRLVFCPDGKLRLAVDKRAIDNGLIVVTDYDENKVGFGLQP